MLAISGSSAYLICTFKSNEGNKCLYKCNNNPLIDTTKPNSCEGECNNYILMPENICIESCDENIFTVIDNNNNKQCGLCRDLNKANPYKLINTKKCFSSPPEGTKIIDEKLKLINCSDGYTLKNDACIVDKCNSHCKTCKGYSEDDNNQNCISCKNENEVVLNGNCIEKCPERYFVKDSNCYECDNSCLACSENPKNCTKCVDGEYLDESNFTCNNCTEHCKTCSKGLENENENCLSCDLNSELKYLIKAEGFNSNCVDKCPENTTEKNNECVGFKDDGKKQNDTLLFVFIIITAVLLLLIMVCFFKNYCCRPKNHDEKLMKEINTELIESKNIVD
jgi:proprotein convertase subtilisin/kexin type 5